MGKHIATVSTRGWVGTIEHKGDYLLSCFLLTLYSQSVLYYGKLASLQYVLKEEAGDQVYLQQTLSSMLNDMLKRNFDSSSALVKLVDYDATNSSKLRIRATCMVRENDIEYNLGKEVLVLNSKVVRISEINNG